MSGAGACLLPDEPEREDGGNGEAEGHHQHGRPVRLQEAQRRMSVLPGEIGKGEISNDSGDCDDAKKPTPADLESARTEDRNFHRHGKRRYGRDKHSNQAVLFKPGMKALTASRSNVFFQKHLTAFTGNTEQDAAPDKRACYRAKGRWIGQARGIHRNRDEQGVNAADRGYAGRIGNSQQEEAERTPCDKSLNQTFQFLLREHGQQLRFVND